METTTRTEITVEETEEQRGFVSWSPRKNDLGGHGEPLKDWLPTMGDVGMKEKQGKVSNWAPSSSIWSDAPLNPWVPEGSRSLSILLDSKHLLESRQSFG